ncbi:MAG: cytochrome C [Proteobacteria bacterium]|nr:cytochrome C [Pseudomonadota bacterium]
MKNITNLFIMFCVCGFIHVQFSQLRAAEAEQSGTVRSSVRGGDCVKCHESIVLTLQRMGKAHRQLCLDCHQGHPPADMEIVPSCSRCHREGPHFALPGCLKCHTDPHQPLEISFTRDITAPCLACHKQQSEQLLANPSIHSKLACSACHTFHGQIQPCQNCHLPHSDTMGRESCHGCHKAHMPLVVAYGENIVSEDCGSCHKDVYEIMAATWSKHRKVPCVQCHAGRHAMIPRCQDCHGEPHPLEIWAKFKECADCHGVAHELWATKASKNKFAEKN